MATVRLTLQPMAVETVPLLLPGIASPRFAVVITAELTRGPGQAADETDTVAVAITRLLAATMGKTALLAEQVKVVLVPLGVQDQVGVPLLVSAVKIMPFGSVSVIEGILDTMVVAD